MRWRSHAATEPMTPASKEPLSVPVSVPVSANTSRQRSRADRSSSSASCRRERVRRSCFDAIRTPTSPLSMRCMAACRPSRFAASAADPLVDLDRHQRQSASLRRELDGVPLGGETEARFDLLEGAHTA